MQEENTITKEIVRTYYRRLEFYWQYIAVYSIALLVYALMKGTVIDRTISFVFWDPVVLLLLIFILATTAWLLYQYFKKLSIIVDIDSITLKTRFKEKKFTLDMIRRIALSKERRVRAKKPVRVIKIRLFHRRFPLRIRPSTYWNEKELVQDILKLKKSLKDFLTKNIN
jgi:hypothetical protein